MQKLNISYIDMPTPTYKFKNKAGEKVDSADTGFVSEDCRWDLKMVRLLCSGVHRRRIGRCPDIQ